VIAILHRGDEIRFAVKHDAALLKLALRKRDVGAGEIDRRAVSRLFGPAGFLQQQPNAAAIEKGQIIETIEPPDPRASR
jgi:hypothetical protein